MAKKKAVSLGVATHFDYQVLPSAQREIVQQRTGEIRERLQRSAQDIWEIGQRLADVRVQLKHGQFEAWLKAEFDWSRRTAYNFINVYETFQERANLAQIDIATSALYLLAAPSTPQGVRDEYLQQAREGKKVTHKDLRETMERDRPLSLFASSAESLGSAESNVEKREPSLEIVTLIPRAEHASVIDVAAQAILEKPILEKPVTPEPSRLIPRLKSGWYSLNQRHLLFCGDTATADFYEAIPDAAFALAATATDWDHDWLVDGAKSVTILPESELQENLIEQLILMFSKPEETVLFPWLPNRQMIAIAHRLGRKVVAGDASLERCQLAVQAAGWEVEAIALNR
ncbi:MAG: DUF3102 domain-containing protein [Leptolyngbyaceae cyanobacterium CSU_1_4]|nr:DUF3102 domain-containing protein [Leptolyngbyaceae cyanobacterium CSU_1_4]